MLFRTVCHVSKIVVTFDMKSLNAPVSMLKIDTHLPGVQLRELLIFFWRQTSTLMHNTWPIFVEVLHYFTSEILKVTKLAVRMVYAWLQSER